VSVSTNILIRKCNKKNPAVHAYKQFQYSLCQLNFCPTCSALDSKLTLWRYQFVKT